MKRSDLPAHPSAHGCQLAREGSRHSIWINPSNANIQAVSRHREIKKFTARSIFRKLDVPPPPGP